MYNYVMARRDNPVVTWLGSAAIVLFLAIVVGAILLDGADILRDAFS